MQEAAIRAQLAAVHAELKRVEVEYSVLNDLSSAYLRWMQVLGYDNDSATTDVRRIPEGSRNSTHGPIGNPVAPEVEAGGPEPIATQDVDSNATAWDSEPAQDDRATRQPDWRPSYADRGALREEPVAGRS